MTDVRTIAVDPKPPGKWHPILRQGIIWVYLVGAEAVSHLLFGGSWVIDIMVLTMLALFVISQAMRGSGASVNMTPAEIRLWVAAGMPNDIKAWRELRSLKEVA